MKIMSFGLLAILLGCSAGPGVHTGYITDIDEVVLTRSLVKQEKVFVSYSPTTKRISVIDPVERYEKESYFIPEPLIEIESFESLDGIAAASESNLYIISNGFTQKYSIPSWTQLGVSQQSPTVALVCRDDPCVTLFKYLKSSGWQQSSLSLGLVANKDSRVLLNATATRALVFDVTLGVFEVFSATDSDSAFGRIPDLTCEATAEVNAPWAFVTMDPENNRVYFSAESGALSYFSIEDTSQCPVINSYDIETPLLIKSLEISDQGEVLITYEGGTFAKVFWSPQSLSHTIDSTPCEEPRFGKVIDANSIGYFCLIANPSSVDLEDKFSSVNYEIWNSDTGEVQFSLINFPWNSISGAAIDSESNALYIMRDSSLGILEEYNTDTGEKYTYKGLYLENLFESL